MSEESVYAVGPVDLGVPHLVAGVKPLKVSAAVLPLTPNLDQAPILHAIPIPERTWMWIPAPPRTLNPKQMGAVMRRLKSAHKKALIRVNTKLRIENTG